MLVIFTQKPLMMIMAMVGEVIHTLPSDGNWSLTKVGSPSKLLVIIVKVQVVDI